MKKFSNKSKENILIFCPSIEEGGVEKNLINVSNYLSNYFKVTLLTANKDKIKYFKSKIKFVTPSSNFFNKKKRILKSLICLYLFFINIKSKKFSILSFQSNIFAIILAIFCKKKIIIRSNTSPHFYAKNIFKRVLFSFFFRYADKIVVNSEEFKKEFFKYFNVLPIRIYNPIEAQSIIKKKMNIKKRQVIYTKKDSLKVLTIGRLVKQKDHMTILKAINLIKHERKLELLIIGKGSEKNNLNNYIKENSLDNYVKIVDYQNNIYPYLSKSDLFVLSSLYEGLPNVLIEALSSGVKIISSNCKSGPREILKQGKLGRLFKIGDYKELAKLISKTKIPYKKKPIRDKRFDFHSNLSEYKKLLLSL